MNLSKWKLYLDWNKIGDDGAKELATANWPNLQQLNLGIHWFYLGNNSIG